MDPRTPGLKEAARDLFRPLIEPMRNQEIIHRYRVPWLVRIDELEVNDDSFQAFAVPVMEIRDSMSGMDQAPFWFGAPWEALRMIGSCIQMNMVTDHFLTDPAIVAKIKTAALRGALPSEIAELLHPSS